MIVIVVFFFLIITEKELIASGMYSITDLFFESVSAFGTVGLSQGLTPDLSILGKIFILCTLFICRTGLFSMALDVFNQEHH